MSQFADYEATKIVDKLYVDPPGAVDLLRDDLGKAQTPGQAAELVGKIRAWQTSDSAGTLVIGPPQWDTCGGPGTANVAIQYEKDGQRVQEIVAPLELQPRACDASGQLLPIQAQGDPAAAPTVPVDGQAQLAVDQPPPGYQPDPPGYYGDTGQFDYGSQYPYGGDQYSMYSYDPLTLVDGLFIMGATGYGVSRWGHQSWSQQQEQIAQQYRQTYSTPQTSTVPSQTARIVAPVTPTNNATNIYNVTTPAAQSTPRPAPAPIAKPAPVAAPSSTGQPIESGAIVGKAAPPPLQHAPVEHGPIIAKPPSNIAPIGSPAEQKPPVTREPSPVRGEPIKQERIIAKPPSGLAPIESPPAAQPRPIRGEPGAQLTVPKEPAPHSPAPIATPAQAPPAFRQERHEPATIATPVPQAPAPRPEVQRTAPAAPALHPEVQRTAPPPPPPPPPHQEVQRTAPPPPPPPPPHQEVRAPAPAPARPAPKQGKS